MIFAFLCTVFVGVCAVALIGMEDSHVRFTRFLEELDQQAAQRLGQQEASARAGFIRAFPTPQSAAETSGEISFTRSLLALSKVDSLVPGDSPVPAPGVSSSLASALPDQSKNHVQAL